MFSINYSGTNLMRQCTFNVGKNLLDDLPVDLKNISSMIFSKRI